MEGPRANGLPGMPWAFPMSDSQRAAMRLVTLGLVVAAAMTLAPFWAPVVLAAWFADVLQPAVRELQRLLGGKRRGASAIVVLLVVAALVPLVGAVAAIVADVRELLAQVRAALEGHGTLAGVLLGGGPEAPHPTFRDWADLAGRYGANAWRALALVARTSASVLLGIVVFAVALYAFAARGGESYRWLARHSPIPRGAFTRFARAFRETGRGLLVGGAGTALIQGAIATIAYVAIGIPRAMLLGPLTAVCAVVPVVGTGLVWVPLVIELAVTGDYVRAGAVAVVGAVVSTVDNFVRPVLTRYGRFRLPAVVVFVSMLGGIAVFGASGVLLGPLLVRLAVEALAIARKGGLFSSRPAQEIAPACAESGP